MGAVSSIVEAVADVGQGLIDVVSDAGSALDDAVRENIPGGWAIPVAVATAGALGTEGLLGAGAGEAASTAAIDAGLAEGAFPGLVEGTVASDAGITSLLPSTGTVAGVVDTLPAVEYIPPGALIDPSANIPFSTPAPIAEGVGSLVGPPLPPDFVTTTPVSTGVVTEAGLPALNAIDAVPAADTAGTSAVGTEVSSATQGIPAALPSGTEVVQPTLTALEPPPEVNVGTAAPKVSDGIAALPTEPAVLPAEPVPPTSVPSTPMEPANPQDFGATIENGGVAPSTVANPVGTGDPGSAPLDTTSNLPGGNAGAAGSSYVTTPGGGIADITGAGTAAAAGAGAGSGLFQSIADATGLPLGAVQTLAAGLGISALGKALQPGTVTNAQGTYTGPLANIRYNPATYTPYTYKPYAAGGIATGGLSDLGGYSDGGRLLRGPGDGVSDSIPAVIGNKQPARLADGEFVIPARIVSELGNGSTEAGARQLYAMMDRIQAARRKTTGKEQVAANTKAAKHLPA